MKRTNEGGKAYEHSLNHALEFFSKAGSLFAKRGTFYGQEASALELFQQSWIVDKALSMKLLLWLRDCRGGAGNRSGARECYKWLGQNEPEWINTNIGWLPMVGRWDDLRSLFGTKSEEAAVKLWAEALKSGDILAAKWADRSDAPVRKYLGMKVGDFRRALAATRKNIIVEHKMCQKDWESIKYDTVPSVAMARYTNAFGRNDAERFEAYKEGLKKGTEKVHADVLFPHDCIRTARNGHNEIADAQFEALPNMMEESNEKVIVISDTSGSMGISVSGDVRAVDISQGLALYCSEKIGEDNIFYRKFIGFCSESEFKDWEGMTLSDAVRDRTIFDGAVGKTRIDTALNLILRTAVNNEIGQMDMPTMLIIVSDMQFHRGCDNKDRSEVEGALTRWDEAGYQRPKIVYWNTAGYNSSPATAFHPDIAMVSGFSTGVLKAILGGEDFSPIGVMMKAIEKYDIEVP